VKNSVDLCQEKSECLIAEFTVLVLSLFFVFALVQLSPTLRVSAQSLVESDFTVLLNAERSAQGKSLISVNSHLTTAAYLHSLDMAEQNYFSHTSLDGRTFVERIVADAKGAPEAARVFGMWKSSSGHYANMMRDFNEAGLGVYTKTDYTYYTLDLGKNTI